MMLDPKGREAARLWAINAASDGGIPGDDYIDGILTAYLSTVTPAEVGGLVGAQTEARAIAWEVRGAQLHRVFLDEAEARELASRFKGVVTPLVPAAALAAKDAELAAERAALRLAADRAERAETALAEARKELEEIADARVELNSPHDYSRGWNDALFRVRQIARRALTGGRDDG